MNAALAGANTAAAPALIVDDSPFLAQHLARMLRELSLQAQVTSDVAQLHERAAEAALIFVEVELFRGNGFELTRELAALCSCPVVLLTGSGRHTDLQWALRAGASAVLERPVTTAALQNLLHGLACVEPRR